MQNEEMKPTDEQLSPLEKAYRDSKTVSIDELDKLKTEMDLWSIVCVKEQMNKPYILVGKEDDPESRVWLVFTGESKEMISQCFEWIDTGRKLYQSRARSVEEMSDLRQAIIAVGVIGTLDHDDEFAASLVQLVIIDTAIQWYINDHPGTVFDKEVVTKKDDFAPYADLALRYTQRLSKYFESIKMSSESFEQAEKPA